MPIYEYECPLCGRYEVIQRITEPALTRCEKCGGKKLTRLVSATTFSLKGTGWYATDYKTNRPSKEPTGSEKSGDKKDSKGKKGGSAAA